MGMCIGYLAGSTERVRGRMAPGLVGAARDPAVSRELTDSLILVLQDAGSDPYHRARAADALRHVRCEDCPRSLAGVLEDPQEPVRFFAARSLHHLGDARGTRALEVFSQHSSEAVRALARMALETVTE
jgi:HEAT repeat protein